MRLLALSAVERMAFLLMERLDLPTEEWCKGRPGSVLGHLCNDLELIPPEDKTISLAPVWNHWMRAE